SFSRDWSSDVCSSDLQRLQQGLILNAGLAGLGIMVADNNLRDIILGGAALGATLTVAKYGRGHELESDSYGMEYMARAGYDPQESGRASRRDRGRRAG